ncbi:type II toxin-antitoxin system VapC family toxin [Pantanalinema rosaneae CENA516]|uniref:type II toxin-antitoxin system VapC family toxin n=1 Tax=Pantanalinema rosaneae TaxID=1620701 RepID=UPI003D6FB2E4
MLDTCVISELITKQPNQQVIAWLDALPPPNVYLSVITIGEISKGITRLPDSRRKRQLDEWLHQELLVRFADRIAEIDLETMLIWGELAGRLERNGHPMPAIDSLIAAIALRGDFHLATRNTNDFRETGVNIVNPWQA